MSAPVQMARRIGALAARAGLPLALPIRSGVGKGLRLQLQNATRSHLRGDCELPVQQVLTDRLRPGDVFLDVGASIGFFTLMAARLVGPEGLVYAVEPVASNADAIETNARINHLGNVRTVRAAAGARNGQGMLFLARHAGGATLSEADRPPDLVGEVSVPVVSLDQLIADGRMRPPSLVKIDVEGAELAVLEGMAECLARHRPQLVFEVDDRDAEIAETKFAALTGWLRHAGYETERLDQCYQDVPWTVLHGFARPDAY